MAISRRNKLLLVGVGLLIVGALVTVSIRLGIRAREASERAKQEERHRQDSLQAIQDRIAQFIALTDSLIFKKEYDSALVICDTIIVIDSTRAEAYRLRGDVFRLRKKYDEAIVEYSEAIQCVQTSGRCWYERAVCYNKQKKKKEAVADLKQAMALGYPGADSLHEKINPLKKRVVGSHTICCDGTISYSTGRGTCSHHGGVCGTEYEYQTYREY